MKSRKILRVLALGMTLAPLAACMAPRDMLADNEAVPLAVSVCDEITGTRIRTKAIGECRPSKSPLKAYTADELWSTGEVELGDALRQIDMAFR